MFGLTRREQRWKAEQQAAELLAGLAAVAIQARVQMDANDQSAEIAQLRAELEALKNASKPE